MKRPVRSRSVNHVTYCFQFPGVESKLDYLKDIGVGSVALSPFFPSPMKDGGYDITDYQDVDSK